MEVVIIIVVLFAVLIVAMVRFVANHGAGSPALRRSKDESSTPYADSSSGWSSSNAVFLSPSDTSSSDSNCDESNDSSADESSCDSDSGGDSGSSD